MAKSFYYDTANIDLEALQRISSGLYVLTTFDKKIANGCIIDSIAFASHKPKKIVVCISKGSLTAEMIKESNVFTLSALSQSAPWSLIHDFGYKSGLEFDKIRHLDNKAKGLNGCYYITKHVAFIIECVLTEVFLENDRYLLVGTVTASRSLSDEPVLTYDYYCKNIRKKDEHPGAEKTWKCSVCGYVYQATHLTKDVRCPVCGELAEEAFIHEDPYTRK